MLGSALKLSIQSNAPDTEDFMNDFYFPTGTWCNVVNAYDPCIVSTGQTERLGTKVYEFGLHLRDGHVAPLQDAKAVMPRTTADMARQPINLHVNLFDNTTAAGAWEAEGHLVNDDGLSVDPLDRNNAYAISFTYDATSLTMAVTHSVTAKEGLDPDVCAGCVNMNDRVALFAVYNAGAVGLTADLTDIVLTKPDETTVTIAGAASYDAETDQLSFTPPEGTLLNLPEIKQIVFK